MFHLKHSPLLRAGVGPVAVAVTAPGLFGFVARYRWFVSDMNMVSPRRRLIHWKDSESPSALPARSFNVTPASATDTNRPSETLNATRPLPRSTTWKRAWRVFASAESAGTLTRTPARLSTARKLPSAPLVSATDLPRG